MAFGKGNLKGGGIAEGTPISGVAGSQQANLYIDYTGKGILISLGNGDVNARIFSITINGAQFMQLTLQSRESIKLEIPFETGYKVYALTAGQPAYSQHLDESNAPVMLTANTSASGVQSSQISYSGAGVIKFASLIGNPTLIVDGITILDQSGLGGAELEIPFTQSFDFQNSSLTNFVYNKTS